MRRPSWRRRHYAARRQLLATVCLTSIKQQDVFQASEGEEGARVVRELQSAAF